MRLCSALFPAALTLTGATAAAQTSQHFWAPFIATPAAAHPARPIEPSWLKGTWCNGVYPVTLAPASTTTVSETSPMHPYPTRWGLTVGAADMFTLSTLAGNTLVADYYKRTDDDHFYLYATNRAAPTDPWWTRCGP